MPRHITRRDFLGLGFAAAVLGVGCTPGYVVRRALETKAQEPLESKKDEVLQQEDVQQDPAEQAASEQAAPEQNTRRVLSFDMHTDTVDTLSMYDLEPYSTLYAGDCHYGTLASSDANVSVDRMGDVGWAQCYAVWTPDDCPSVSHADFYRQGASYFKQQMAEFPDVFEHIRDGRSIRAAINAGKVAAILTVENSCGMEEGMQMLDEFERDGVLVCGLTWNGSNVVGGGAYTGEGLTSFGAEYVGELERRRMVMDVSHASDATFWDAEGVARRAFIATHSNARAVCDVPRNLTDDQFKAIRDRGGVVGLNFYGGFVNGGAGYSFEELAAHVEHWLDLGGSDVVALGSDRDGSSMPDWLRDCSQQEDLYYKFVDHLGEEQAQKLFFQNAADFFERNAS